MLVLQITSTCISTPNPDNTVSQQSEDHTELSVSIFELILVRLSDHLYYIYIDCVNREYM